MPNKVKVFSSWACRIFHPLKPGLFDKHIQFYMWSQSRGSRKKFTCAMVMPLRKAWQRNTVDLLGPQLQYGTWGDLVVLVNPGKGRLELFSSTSWSVALDWLCFCFGVFSLLPFNLPHMSCYILNYGSLDPALVLNSSCFLSFWIRKFHLQENLLIVSIIT